MSIVRRTSPFGELLSLRQAMDRLFEDSYVRPREWSDDGSLTRALPLDIHATDDSLVVEAALPGIKPDDVDITITGDTLSITGKAAREERREEGGYLYQELQRGTFSRTVSLPADLDTEAAQANFENGLLTLTIPKAEQAKPRQIKVSASGGASARDVSPSRTSNTPAPGDQG